MKKMILCPTRGGRSSYPNQDMAIELAKKRQADLLFLYISNVRFLGMTASPVVVDIETELDEMGDFLLTMAQERAEKAGVHAETSVRRGVFQKVLREVIHEYPISAVVLGSSTAGTGVTTPEFVQSLVAAMSDETGLEFIILRDGKIISTTPAD